MATYSSIFAWRIPWTEECGSLQSMGSQTVRHNWSDWAYEHEPRTKRCYMTQSYCQKAQPWHLTRRFTFPCCCSLYIFLWMWGAGVWRNTQAFLNSWHNPKWIISVTKPSFNTWLTERQAAGKQNIRWEDQSCMRFLVAFRTWCCIPLSPKGWVSFPHSSSTAFGLFVPGIWG